MSVWDYEADRPKRWDGDFLGVTDPDQSVPDFLGAGPGWPAKSAFKPTPAPGDFGPDFTFNAAAPGASKSGVQVGLTADAEAAQNIRDPLRVSGGFEIPATAKAAPPMTAAAPAKPVQAQSQAATTTTQPSFDDDPRGPWDLADKVQSRAEALAGRDGKHEGQDLYDRLGFSGKIMGAPGSALNKSGGTKQITSTPSHPSGSPMMEASGPQRDEWTRPDRIASAKGKLEEESLRQQLEWAELPAERRAAIQAQAKAAEKPTDWRLEMFDKVQREYGRPEADLRAEISQEIMALNDKEVAAAKAEGRNPGAVNAQAVERAVREREQLRIFSLLTKATGGKDETQFAVPTPTR